MLSISEPLKGDRRIQYYLNLPQEDYYTFGTEGIGYWAGQGARQLGLHGRVERETFRHLLFGLSPDGSTPFVQNALDQDRPKACRCSGGWPRRNSVGKSNSFMSKP